VGTALSLAGTDWLYRLAAAAKKTRNNDLPLCNLYISILDLFLRLQVRGKEKEARKNCAALAPLVPLSAGDLNIFRLRIEIPGEACAGPEKWHIVTGDLTQVRQREIQDESA
jgi:hypothetical protein